MAAAAALVAGACGNDGDDGSPSPSKSRLIVVERAIAQTDGGELIVQPPKNRRQREVPVTASTHRRLVRRVQEVVTAPVGDGAWPAGGRDGLLFPGPSGSPWTRSTWRRGVFTPAERAAGWDMVGDKPSARGLLRGGSPKLPWRNLRHHAATWLHHTAGIEWEEVSHILGHHSVAFTLDTYVRRGADSEERIRQRLDRF